MTQAAIEPRDRLLDAARDVLAKNDLGGWTKPAPTLYPHQWSWDSAFIAIGLTHYNNERALLELETLFHAQWTDGRVPHIVFNPAAADYFPGPDRWNCGSLNGAAPATHATSGLIQPPVHALAAWRIYEADTANGGGLRSRLQRLYKKLFAWHEYLATRRDSEGWGLISIYHPWESGTDNSPRWDEPLSRVKVGDVPPYTRRDTKHVADASERPTQAEYDRFLWLVETLKAAHYDDDAINKTHPFIVKDVLMSAIFAMANRALARLAAALEAPAPERARIAAWEERVRQGLHRCYNSDLKLSLDLDVRNAGRQICVSTCAGLAPLLVPDPNGDVLSLAERLLGPDFAGHRGFAFAVIPSTTPGTAGYHPRAYWRGPSWPVVNPSYTLATGNTAMTAYLQPIA
jgi:hypothetical protein